MGSKYNYHSIFLERRDSEFYFQLVRVGLAGLWNRFGQPKTLSIQDFEHSSVKDYEFSADNFVKLFPPKENEIIVIYPESIGRFSVTLCLEGHYLVVSASVEFKIISDQSRRDIFDELKSALRDYQLNGLIAGEEIEVCERLIENLRHGIKSPHREIQAEFF